MKKLASLAVLLLLPSVPDLARAGNSCVEQSDIVGDRVCGRYGDRWSAERTFPVVFGVGVWSGHVVPSGRSWSGSFGKDNPIKFSIPGQHLGMSTVNDFGLDFRLHGFVSRTFYVGLDWAIALGRVHTNVVPREGFEMRDKGSINYVHARIASVVGGRVPLGPLSLRLETLIGLQIASVSLEGRKTGGDWVQGSFTSAALLLEPRVAVDLWTTPWSTITAWGSTNLMFPTDRGMGLSIALHGRAFDGHF